MAIVQVIAGVLVWLELAVRNAAIYLAVLFFPVALAASIWPTLAGWTSRLVRLLFLFVILKPVVLVVLAFAGNAALAGLSLHGGLASSAGTIIAAITIFALAAMAPWALMLIVAADAESAAVGAGVRAAAGHAVSDGAATAGRLGGRVRGGAGRAAGAFGSAGGAIRGAAGGRRGGGPAGSGGPSGGGGGPSPSGPPADGPGSPAGGPATSSDGGGPGPARGASRPRSAAGAAGAATGAVAVAAGLTATAPARGSGGSGAGQTTAAAGGAGGRTRARARKPSRPDANGRPSTDRCIVELARGAACGREASVGSESERRRHAGGWVAVAESSPGFGVLRCRARVLRRRIGSRRIRAAGSSSVCGSRSSRG